MCLWFACLKPFFFFFFPPAGPKRPHMVLNRRVINKLICVQRPKIWKATNSAHSSSTASGLQSRSVQDDSFFSPRSGWRAPHTTFNRKAAFFFFSRCFFHSFPPPSTFLSGCQLHGGPFHFQPAPKNKVQSSESLCVDLGHLESLPLSASHR